MSDDFDRSSDALLQAMMDRDPKVLRARCFRLLRCMHGGDALPDELLEEFAGKLCGRLSDLSACYGFPQLLSCMDRARKYTDSCPELLAACFLLQELRDEP
jgi:hypothetical protein